MPVCPSTGSSEGQPQETADWHEQRYTTSSVTFRERETERDWECVRERLCAGRGLCVWVCVFEREYMCASVYVCVLRGVEHVWGLKHWTVPHIESNCRGWEMHLYHWEEITCFACVLSCLSPVSNSEQQCGIESIFICFVQYSYMYYWYRCYDDC
jgi:hypothetical protein